MSQEFIEKEAPVDENEKKKEDIDDEDSENDDHVPNVYQNDGFIVDDDQEEEVEGIKHNDEEDEEDRPKKVRILTKGRRIAPQVEEEKPKETTEEIEKPKKRIKERTLSDDEEEGFTSGKFDDAREIFGDDFEIPVVEVGDEEEVSTDKFKKN